MSGLSDYAAKAVLNHLTGEAAIFSVPTTYLALFTAVGVDAGTGFTEVSGNGYARVSTSGLWSAAIGSSPSSITTSGTIAFPTATGSQGTVIAWGLYDALTNGNLIAWDYLGNNAWQPCSISSASPGLFTAHAHGFSAADSVIFSTEMGGTAPTFSQSNLSGTLTVAASPGTDTFSVTNAATAVNTSATGNGLVRKIASQQIVAGVQFQILAGNIILSQA